MNLMAAHRPRAAILSLAMAALVMTPFNIPLLARAPEQDSFFTLSATGSAVLALLSAALLAAVFWLLGVKSDWVRARFDSANSLSGAGLVSLDILSGWLIYLLAHHLSPQLYYLYYMTLFDELTLKWVISSAYDWPRFTAAAIPGPKQRLADFLACAGFWAVLPYTALLHRQRRGGELI